MGKPTSLKGKAVLITGTLENYTRPQAKKAAEKAGAVVKSGLSGNVEVVVMGGGDPKFIPEDHPAVVISEKAFKKLVAVVEESDEEESAPPTPKKKKAGNKRKQPEPESESESESESSESAPPPKKKSKLTSLKGKNVLITGTLDNYSRKEAKAAAEKAGATVKPGLSGTVNVVVLGTKNAKDIPSDHAAVVINENAFKALVGGGDSDSEESESEESSEKPPPKKKAKKSKLGTLDGKNVLVTGTLEDFTRAEAKEAIEEAGGTVKTSITKNVEVVVMGEKNAKSVPAGHAAVIISEAEFKTLL